MTTHACPVCGDVHPVTEGLREHLTWALDTLDAEAFGHYVDHKAAARAALAAQPARLTHGRHCPCSACAREDWTNPNLAPCGMHGPSCPAVYAPIAAQSDAPRMRRSPAQVEGGTDMVTGPYEERTYSAADDPEYHQHVAGYERHSHPYSGPHSHGGVSALIETPRETAAREKREGL